MLALMEGITSQDATGANGAPQPVPSDISDAIFARRLRAVREASGMTQQQLADAMAGTGNRIHRSTIGKIESGDRPVTVGEAVQLAGILGVDLAELVTDLAPGSGHYETRRARIEAMVRLRGLQHEAKGRRTLLEEAQLLYEDTVRKINEAREHLAGLDAGKDDQ